MYSLLLKTDVCLLEAHSLYSNQRRLFSGFNFVGKKITSDENGFRRENSRQKLTTSEWSNFDEILLDFSSGLLTVRDKSHFISVFLCATFFKFHSTRFDVVDLILMEQFYLICFSCSFSTQFHLIINHLGSVYLPQIYWHINSIKWVTNGYCEKKDYNSWELKKNKTHQQANIVRGAKLFLIKPGTVQVQLDDKLICLYYFWTIYSVLSKECLWIYRSQMEISQGET